MIGTDPGKEIDIGLEKEIDTDLERVKEMVLGPEKEKATDLERVKEKGITGRDMRTKCMSMKEDTTVTDIVIAAPGAIADMTGHLAEGLLADMIVHLAKDPLAENRSKVGILEKVPPDKKGNP